MNQVQSTADMPDSFLLSEASVEDVETGVSVRYDTPGDTNDASSISID